MGRELGRISGPLLAENLLRNGNNLAFETNLLYLNVVNGWLGVRTSTPVRTLTVNSTTNTDYLIAPNGTTEAGTFNLGFTTYQIKNLLGNIILAPDPASDPTVTTKRIGTSELRISTGLIQNIVNNHDINLTAATGQQVIFTTDTLDIGGNLHATGDITWDGNITFGNVGDENDTVTFYSEVASHIIPDATSTYDLGRASPDRWRHLYANNIDVSSLIGVGDISVTNLTVNGPGILRNDVILANTNFKSTISNSLIPTLDNTYKIGTSTGPKRWKTLFLTGLDVDGIIDIRNNRITTLDFTGIDGGSSSLTGSILDGGSSFGAVPDILDGGLSSSPFSVDLELVADGLGNIYVTSTDVRIVQDLTVDGNSVVTNVGITGQLDLTGDWNQTGTAQRTGDTDITGSLTVNGANTVQFQEIKFVSNRVTTTTGTNNLELVADGLGIVKTLLSDVEITNDLEVLLTAYTNVVNITTSATANDFIIDSIYIVNNTITTNTAISANTDLQLLANTTGIVQVTTTDVAITNDLTVDGNSTLANVSVGTVLTPATLSLTGDWNQTGAVDRTGDTDITGFIKVNGANIVQFDNIKFDSNRIVATTTDSDLIFTANGTGIVKVLTSDVEIDLDLDVTGDGFFNTANVDNTVIMDEFTIDDIYINDNKITTNIVSGANTNLILKADDTGQIYVPLTDVVITNDLEVNGLTTVTDLNIGTVSTSYAIDLTGNWNQTGTINRTGNTDITGSLTVNGGVGASTFATSTNYTNLPGANGAYVSNYGTLRLAFQASGWSNPTEFQTAKSYTSGSSITITVNGQPPFTTTLTSDFAEDGMLPGQWLATIQQNPGMFPFPTGNIDTFTIGNASSNTVQFDDIQIVGNKIATTVGPNLVITADGLLSTVNVNGTDVTISNDLTILGDGSFGALEVTNTIDAVDFTAGNIYITDNVIATTSGNLILGADNTGQVQVDTADVEIANNLTVGALTVNGNTTVLNTVIRTELITPTTTQTAQNVSGTSTPTGFFFYGWADDPGQINSPFGVIQVGWSCVEIPGSVVTVVGDGVTNYDITITGGSFASGGFYSFTGDVVTYGPANAVQVGNIVQTGTVGVDGNFESGTITGTSATSFLTVPDIKIDGPVISVTAANTDLLLSANGYGGVRFDRYLQITGNDISSIFDANNIDLAFGNLLLAEDGDFLLAEDGDNLLADTIIDSDLSIVLTPNGTGNLVISSNKAFAVAVGNNTNRVLRDIGEIRQNSTNQVYEGRLATGNARFTNIYDADFNTYVTPELTPGANDNILRFGVNGTVKATISSTELYSNTIHVDNVSISNNTISNLNSSTNLEFIPNGTGVLNVNDVYFKTNTITNTTNGALTLESTGTGYVRFGGNAVVFPVGNNSNRGPVYEIGETRYNTELQYLEVYDGTNWVSAGGTSAYATLEEIQAELDLWSLILG